MREKIEAFAKGEFEFELPYLNVSEDTIKIDIEAGKVYENSLTISNSAQAAMEGVLYSSNRLFTLDSTSFNGTECMINYRFDASFLKAGDIIRGELCIVSNFGDHTIPFTVQVEAPYCMTSIGKVKDLFQFANLARMDWTEAKKVFRSEDFERVILGSDEKYKVIYHNLLKNISTSQALEEFLITIHKKSKINLSIDKTKIEYEAVNGEFMDKLILTKDHWGYAEIRVSTDAPFIQLEQKFVWADRFIGNAHQVSFLINSNNMRPGNNYGRIWIKTVYQTITVEVVCSYHKSEAVREEVIPGKREIYRFIRSYLDFRMDRISLEKYISEAETMLKRIPDTYGGNFVRLIKTHLAVISDKNKAAGQLLGEFAREEAVLRKQSALEYCAYLYLDALYRKDEETIKYVTETIRRIYESGHNDFRILWFLLYTDKRYEKNKSLKLSDIREQFDAGCRSPIMYFEAVLIFIEEPQLLRDLTDFEIQVLHFGASYGIVNEEVVLQYNYLVGRRKNYHPIIFGDLTRFYEKYNSTDTLSAICCMLIKGLKKSAGYFEWYRLGVEAQLRITELYEYYMYSADEAMEEPIAEPVLLYFIYNSSLNDKKRAFLYANIIINKDKNEAIYRTYYKKMEVFAEKQLEAHNITPNLAVLYREFMGKGKLSPDMAQHLPYVMFTNELICENANMVAVTVVNKETEEEEHQPLTLGRAHIQLYTRNEDIFLQDAFGNRYNVSVDYTLSPLLKPEELDDINPELVNNPMLLLYLFVKYQSYKILNENAVSVRKQILSVPGLTQECYMDCLKSLIDYYYENYDDELLSQYLLKLDLGKVNEADRIKYLEYMVIRGYYDKALEAFKVYGYENIPVGRLVKFCSGWVKYSGLDNRQEFVVNLCYFIFSQGKYDETVLTYLIKHYNGPTLNMYGLWQAAEDFELEVHLLSERLLVQMLFAEGYAKDSFKVFHKYYLNVTNRTLVKAYLTFYAYKYLVHDKVINEELFPIMRRELNYDENDICLLAWIKHNRDNGRLTDNELDYIALNLRKFVKKGIILPYFLDYGKVLKLPEGIADKFYVEYKADPGKKVYLHYRLVKGNAEEEFITERMDNVLLGIHVKDFLLFYHEVLQYYITEEISGEVNVSESFDVCFDRETAKDESKYGQINLMLTAMEMQDDKTLFDTMEHYVKSEYLISKCFKPIE